MNWDQSTQKMHKKDLEGMRKAMDAWYASYLNKRIHELLDSFNRERKQPQAEGFDVIQKKIKIKGEGGSDS